MSRIMSSLRPPAGEVPRAVRPRGVLGSAEFGTVEIDREFLKDAGEASLFHVLAHEIGHVIRRVVGEIPNGSGSAAYADEGDRHMDGAERGRRPRPPGAVPGRCRSQRLGEMASAVRWPRNSISSTAASAPRSWPTAVRNDLRPAFLPHAIDFAFLADLGMTVRDETDRPETYGLVGWTDHAGFSLSVLPRPANRHWAIRVRRLSASFKHARRHRPAAGGGRRVRPAQCRRPWALLCGRRPVGHGAVRGRPARRRDRPRGAAARDGATPASR